MRNLGLLFLFSFLILSCTNDAYETGDSQYSYLRTDFVEAQTDAKGYIVSAIRDDGVKLDFSQPISSSWATKSDSSYRALLYYNIDGSAENGNNWTVKPMALRSVYVLKPILNSDTLASHTDPVHFQSSWESKNKKYFNVSVALMTGTADSVDAIQSVGLLCDSVVTNYAGSNTFYFKLLHNQGGVPQYYKTTVYLSIPTQKMTIGDSVRLSLNTYDGWIVREYGL